MKQDVTFESEGVELSGWNYTPDLQPLWPIVVMAHGYSATRRRMTAENYAEVFRARASRPALRSLWIRGQRGRTPVADQ